MTGGESRRGAFSGVVGIDHHLIEESFGMAWSRQHLLMEVEVAANVGEHAPCNIINAHGQIVEHGTRDGNHDEDDIIKEEGGHDDERATTEICVLFQEIIDRDQDDQREIGHIAQVHQFRKHDIRAFLGKQQGRLTTEKLLFPTGKHMVEIGQHAVDLVGIRIPPRQQGHLHDDTQETSHTAGQHAIDSPHEQGGDSNTYAPPDHGIGILHLGIAEEDDKQREQQVGEHHPLHGHQPFLGLLLYLEQFFYLYLHLRSFVVCRSQPVVFLIPLDSQAHALFQLELWFKS